MTITRIGIIGLAIVLTGAAKHQPPAPTVISLAPSAWSAHYSSGVTLKPLVGMAGFFFDMPAPPGHVNYLTTKRTTPLLESQTISVAGQIVTTSGDPVFIIEPEYDGSQCGTPSVRLYFEQTLPKHVPNATEAPDTFRWWSNPDAVVFEDGSFALSAPVAPGRWSDAGGRFATDPLAAKGWAAALASPGAVGVTFGGCFFGHGVQVVDGTARFILTSYTIQSSFSPNVTLTDR